MSKNTLKQSQTEEAKGSLRGEVLLVFGQGPVIDTDTRQPPSITTPAGNEDINFWSRDLASAASLLYQHSTVNSVVLLGGKTGGRQYKSEAELMAEYMRRQGVPMGAIELEQESLFTVENIVNFLNLHDCQGNIEKGEFVVSALAAPFHGTRVKLMLALFAVPIKNFYTSDAVLRYDARTKAEDRSMTEDASLWRHEWLNSLDRKLNVNTPEDFYKHQKGLERKDIIDRLVHEDIYTRELLEYPERWLSYLNHLQNPERITQILHLANRLCPAILSKNQISIPRNPHEEQALTELRRRLAAIKYEGLAPEKIEEWKRDLQKGHFLSESLMKNYRLLIASRSRRSLFSL